MGCKSSQEQVKSENIEYDFDKIGLEKYDKQWEECLNQMKQLEKTRMEIELLLINLQQLTNSTQLKQHTLTDLFNIFMWSMEAQAQIEGKSDQIENEIQLAKQSPYLKCNVKDIYLQEFKYTWDQLMINIYQNKIGYDQLCSQVQKVNQAIQQQNVTIKADVAALPQNEQANIIKNQQKNTQIYRNSIGKIVAYQKEFDQIKSQMDTVVSNYTKNKSDITAKANQCIQNNWQALNQAVQAHSGAKVNEKQLEEKNTELSNKHQLLQVEFKKISKKPSEKKIQKISTLKKQETNEQNSKAETLVQKEEEQKQEKVQGNGQLQSQQSKSQSQQQLLIQQQQEQEQEYQKQLLAQYQQKQAEEQNNKNQIQEVVSIYKEEKVQSNNNDVVQYDVEEIEKLDKENVYNLAQNKEEDSSYQFGNMSEHKIIDESKLKAVQSKTSVNQFEVNQNDLIIESHEESNQF